MRREHAAAVLRDRAEDGGAGAVAEQHGGIAAAGRFVETARVDFGADEQDVLVLAGADPGVRDRESIDETAALIPDVHRRNVREAQLALQKDAIARLEMVWRAGAIDDAVDVARA